MGRKLTLLVEAAFAGALAIPFVFLLSLSFFGVTSAAVYLFVSWLAAVAVLTLTAGIILRTEAPNDASLRFVKVSAQSQEKPQPVASKEAS